MVKENNRDDGNVKLFPKIIGIASLLKNETLTSHRSENWPSPRSIPYCLELVLLVRASSFNYKKQYRDHDRFAPLILTYVLSNWAHRQQMSVPGSNLILSKCSVPKENSINYAQKRQICRENSKHASDENFVAIFAVTETTEGCQLTRSLEGEQCLYLEGAIDHTWYLSFFYTDKIFED